MNRSRLVLFLMFSATILFAQDGYVKEFYFPQAGLRMSYPLTAKQVRNTDTLITYTYEHFDNSGKNIGAGEMNIYPKAQNWSREELIRQTHKLIKGYKLGDSHEILSTDVKVRKGVYEMVIIKSIYRLNNEKATFSREDYFYRGCASVAHMMFIVPSYNCYLTEYRRQLITHNYFKWYRTNVKDDALGITLTYPNGLFTITRHSNNKGLAFRSCTPEYKSEIDLFKLDTATLTGLKAVAAKRFSDIKSQTSTGYNWKEYKVDSIANQSIVLSYNRKMDNVEYNFIEYVFKVRDNYFAFRIKSSCADIDMCGNGFMEEVEKIISSISELEPIKKKPVDDTDVDDFWGF